MDGLNCTVMIFQGRLPVSLCVLEELWRNRHVPVHAHRKAVQQKTYCNECHIMKVHHQKSRQGSNRSGSKQDAKDDR